MTANAQRHGARPAVIALARFVADETSSSSAEYALMILVLAGCAIIALHHIGQSTGRIMMNVGNALEQPASSA